MKTIGIIGGMGPQATCDLAEKIIGLTKANSDQENIPIKIDINTRIPDRTAAILTGGADPRPELIKSAKFLESGGADFLIIACNTPHYFVQDVQNAVKIPIVSMIEETAKEAKNRGLKKVALLATDGTVKSGIYAREFAKQGVEMIVPAEKGQKEVMHLIYDGVKKNDYSIDISGFLTLLENLKSENAEVFVLACTELPIAFEKFKIPAKILDATEILAKVSVIKAGASLK
jgi:aspartate racemase